MSHATDPAKEYEAQNGATRVLLECREDIRTFQLLLLQFEESFGYIFRLVDRWSDLLVHNAQRIGSSFLELSIAL